MENCKIIRGILKKERRKMYCKKCQNVIIWVKEYNEKTKKKEWVGYCKCSGDKYNILFLKLHKKYNKK